MTGSTDRSRRTFIKQSLIAGTGIFFMPGTLLSAEKPEALIILHTNDIHAHIEPFPATDPKHAGRGGLRNLSGLISRIRKKHRHVVLVDAGDMFQGTPYYNRYGGTLMTKLMSRIGYDAGNIGNHEFDHGMSELAMAIEAADFPVLNGNYDLSDTPLNNKVGKTLILKKGPWKIGIYGIGVNPDGLIAPDLCKGVAYKDPVAVANELAETLKSSGCDPVICLSHLGYDDPIGIGDIQLVKSLRNTDIVIGGHSHTFLQRPRRFFDAEDNPVLVAQAGWAGLNLGFIELNISS